MSYRFLRLKYKKISKEEMKLIKRLFSLFSSGKKKAGLALTAMVAVLALAVPVSAAPPDNSIDFSTTDGFGVSIMDIINTAWSFIAQFDTFTMLILAVIIVPTLIGFIIWLMSKMPKFRKTSS